MRGTRVPACEGVKARVVLKEERFRTVHPRVMRSTRPPPDIKPSREELKLLAFVHSILGALNDHAAGVNQLVANVEGLPALAGRVIVAAEHEAWDREVESVHHALAILGNRGFERVLLEYLEALTVLKSDVEEEEREAMLVQRANALRSAR